MAVDQKERATLILCLFLVDDSSFFFVFWISSEGSRRERLFADELRVIREDGWKRTGGCEMRFTHVCNSAIDI